jgi:hypothetical protein
MKIHPELTTKPVHGVSPQSLSSGSVTSAAIDTIGFDAMLVIPMTGVNPGDSTLTITESPDDISYSAVNDEADAPAAVSIAISAADTTAIGFFRLDRRERYVKVTMTTDAVNLVGCTVLLINARDSQYQDVTYSYKL